MGIQRKLQQGKMQKECKMKKAMMLNLLLLFCCFSFGYAAENEEDMRSALRRLQVHYSSLFNYMKHPDVLKSSVSIQRHMKEIESMSEVEVWKPQYEALELEQAGVSAKQLCESPNKITQSRLFLKLARAFNLVYSAWFRIRCVELHKAAALHNERRLDKLLPSTIEKYLSSASKANTRSNFHKAIYLEYDKAIEGQARIGILLERDFPAYNYVDDEIHACKILFSATTAILKSKVNEWDTTQDPDPIDIKTADKYMARVQHPYDRYLQEISWQLLRWNDMITKEKLELSKAYHLHQWMTYHSCHLQLDKFVQYNSQYGIIGPTQHAEYVNAANIAMQDSNHYEELYKQDLQALENREGQASIVEGIESHRDTTVNPASVEDGVLQAEEVDAFEPELEMGLDCNSERDLDLTLCLGFPEIKRWHNSIEMDSLQGKRTKLNQESYFHGAHGPTTSEKSNSESNNKGDLDLNLFLGLPGRKKLPDAMATDSVQHSKSHNLGTGYRCFDGESGPSNSERSNSESRTPAYMWF